MLNLQPVSFKEACDFISKFHRHHLPPQGWKFGIGCNDGIELIGVITVGRPVSRSLDNGITLEITRCCTNGAKNACSKLYSASIRAARSLGYSRLITYILESESGSSLLSVGFNELYSTKGGSWNCISRPRSDKNPVCSKKLFEFILQ